MITLVNEFTVTGDTDEFVRVVNEFNDYMAAQSGARGYRLMRSTQRPNVYVEFADWDDAESHRAAVHTNGFRALVAKLAPLVEKPTRDLFTTVHEHHVARD